ncbi:MAG: transposase [Methanosarcinales archaeon]
MTGKHMLYFIDMAINRDHVHLFIQFPPKYSVSFIAKMLKGRTNRIFSTSDSRKFRMEKN